MIPFASQRGNGDELATHLLNEHDNEYVEIADLRGAIADDLHGAFAEWKAQAVAMTKCENDLYSLSVNSDPSQGLMPRELYDDYLTRVEEALGLAGQPRAVVFHIKEGRNGELREHCHAIWSRIDVQEMKAIHMPFDHDKLMTVTRQFARDHGIELAPGYHRLEERRRDTYRQKSLYEKFQEDSVGLMREERMALITDLWKGRDTPQAFVEALEYHGYILASGKRPYVLVDIYGHTNSLPKLIDDKTANTKAVRNFLGQNYMAETLPSVEEAKEIAVQHRQALKDFQKSQEFADRLDALKEGHAKKREQHRKETNALKQRQDRESGSLKQAQQLERSTQRSAYLSEARNIGERRDAAAPTGLAAFLGKVCGIAAITGAVHKYQDRKRHDVYLEKKREMDAGQIAAREESRLARQMQSFDIERKRTALEKSESREIRSLKLSIEKQRNIGVRRGYEHMPSLQLELSPPGRRAALHKAINRYISPTAAALERSQTSQLSSKADSVTVKDEFAKAHELDPRRTDGDREPRIRGFPKRDGERDGPER